MYDDDEWYPDDDREWGEGRTWRDAVRERRHQRFPRPANYWDLTPKERGQVDKKIRLQEARQGVIDDRRSRGLPPEGEVPPNSPDEHYYPRWVACYCNDGFGGQRQNKWGQTIYCMGCGGLM